jgi:hypothetical protein
MRFVHYEDKVIESGEVIEIALADLLTEAPYARRPPTSDFRINLRDVGRARSDLSGKEAL